MVQEKSRSYLLLIILFLNLVSIGLNADIQGIQDVNQSYNPSNIDDKISIFDTQKIHQLVKLNYDPVIDLAGFGENINITDELSVYHYDTLTVPVGGNDSFSINPMLDYSGKDLTYNITIHSTEKTTNYETVENKDDEDLTTTITMLAQKFTIDSDYAIFHHARMFFKTKAGGYGTDEMKLYIVKEGVGGSPNISAIYANEVNGPYNSVNTLPASSSGNFAYYEFGDSVLESGTYFIVAEKTADDGDDFTGFIWRSQQGSAYAGDAYYYDGSWNVNGARGLTLIIQTQVSDEFGNDVIPDPTDISLQDNGQPITSLTQSISSTGTHTLTADETVDITLNNSYVFDRAVSAATTFQASNSSHLDYSISWDMNFITSGFSILPYSNPSRFQQIFLPSNWNKATPNFLRNGSSFTYLEETYGFSINLNQFLSANTYLNYVITFECTSPNYLHSNSLNAVEFNLGYWETDGINATGYEGSLISSNVFVREEMGVNAQDGQLNFTIYTPNGGINPLKISNPPNIIYSDTSEYSVLDTIQESPGRYAVSTIFDPSIYESDKEGYWTVAYFWTNGTEVGFSSQQITVNKPTITKFILETTHNGGDWNDSITQISRINGDNIRFRVEYLNISDPFFSGEGNPITAANITFDSDWGVVGSASYIDPYYQGIISINAAEGNHSFSVDSSGTFLESDSLVFEVTVFHTFDINPISGSIFNAYYTDDDVIQFQVLDTSNASVQILPDNMNFYLDEALLTEVQDYSINILGTTIELTIYSGSLGLNLAVGSYDIRISVQKQDFFVSYSQANASTTVDLNILEITTNVEIVSSDNEIYHGNETTITFYYVDTIHSENIMGANFDISFDLDPEDAEIIGTPTETMGLYSVTIRINAPDELSINIFLTINKPGYEAKTSITIKSISIIPPIEDGGIPFFIFIIIGIFSAAAIITPTVVVVRRKLTKDKRAEKALFARIYGLYESVLSITKLIIVHKATGLPVYEMDLGSEITLDPSLITGFLTAISSMGIELRGDRAGSVKRLQYKNFLVTGSEAGQFTLYTFSETDLNQEIEDKLTVISEWFAKMFSNITEDWDGSTEVFRINLQGITEKIMKEIHLWIFYPFTVSPYKQAEIEEFTGLRKRLVEYITNGDNVTISRIFDELDDVRIERGLPIVFELIETGILTPVFDAYKIATVRF